MRAVRHSRATGLLPALVLPLALPLALALTLTACGGDDGSSEGAPTGTPSASASSEEGGPASATAPASSATGTPDPPTASPSGSGGTAEQPVVLEPTTRLLDWQPVDGPVRDTVTRSGRWALTVPRGGASYRLEGGGAGRGSARSGFRVSDALLDGRWAVVVFQDKAEQRPSTAEVTELATGRSFRIDGRSDLPTLSGGTWALGDGRVLHATTGPGGRYCTASVELTTRRSTLGWCAPPRHGFSEARLTPGGDSLLTFDDSRPSCRTVVALDGRRATPFGGVPDCTGWDGLLTEDGAVWSVIPNEHRVEAAHFYAREGEGYLDLGPGTAGSLAWCGGAAYFVRDPQREGDPAALMRWTPTDGLTVAYQSPAGQAFLSEPRCGGDTLTLTALAQGGDEQVSARLG